MKHYTRALVFDENRENVLLVKNDQGQWNGVGGVVQIDESPNMAAVMSLHRTADLCGVLLTAFCELRTDKSIVFFYRGFCESLEGLPAKNDTGEKLGLRGIDFATQSSEVVPDLKWMIPMALDARDLVTVAIAK